MTAEQVLDRLKYLYKYEPQIQPLIDAWEEKAKKRYHCDIAHCSIKERGKRTEACLLDDSEANQKRRNSLIGYWLKDYDIYNMVDHLLRHEGPEPWEEWNYVDMIRGRLCFIHHYMPPVERDNLKEGQCRNTGKWIYEYYPQNKKIPGRKKKDLCPCSRCLKLRAVRTEERNAYRRELDEKKKRPKKDPNRYKGAF